MTTAFSVFVHWRHSRKTANELIEKAASAVEDAAIQESRVFDLLRMHGPITHNGHVYWLQHNRITCEPCVDSLMLIVEDAK